MYVNSKLGRNGKVVSLQLEPAVLKNVVLVIPNLPLQVTAIRYVLNLDHQKMLPVISKSCTASLQNLLYIHCDAPNPKNSSKIALARQKLAAC